MHDLHFTNLLLLSVIVGCSASTSSDRLADGGPTVSSTGGIPAGGGGTSGASGRATSGGSAQDGGRGAVGGSGLHDASVADAAPSSTAFLECGADAGRFSGVTPSSISRVRGSNGAFEDRCDAKGNLVDYACEAASRCSSFPNPSCVPYETGRVQPELVDCAGNCKNGRCEDRCPDAGETIVYESTDGAGLFVVRDETDGERYQCGASFDNDLDSFDCITSPRVGEEALIDGSSNGSCAADFFLSLIAKGSDAAPGSGQCALDCRRSPGQLTPPPGTSPSLAACPAMGQMASGPAPGSPDTPSKLTGTNGTFEDRCTADGNLVDYACNVTDHAKGPPWFSYSGQVVATYYDCGGTCAAGACTARCPVAGQTLSFESTPKDGFVLVRNQAEGRRYECVITYDDPTDSFDCSGDVHPGVTASILSLGSSSTSCTATIPELAIAIGSPAPTCSDCFQCKLSCRVTP